MRGALVGDGFDRQMEEQVHPPAWRSPAPLPRYDLVVVGGGTAGLVAAHGAAGLGARVALLERAWIGGDCLVTGCVPSKALLRSARAAADVRRASGASIEARLGEIDFGAVMARVRRLRAQIAENDSARRLADAGVHVFFGQAAFTGADQIRIGEVQLRFGRAVIASGARPEALSVPGADEVPSLTSETVFSLTERPRRLIVVGGGPVGCELAQGFVRLGSEVILVSGARLLPRDDPEASELIASVLAAEGVELRLGARPSQIRQRGREIVVEVGGEEVLGDTLLVAVGRRPNVEELDLPRADVEVVDGKLVLDDRLCTTNRRIFASGDVALPLQFTHAADAASRLVLHNALFWGRKRASELVIPWCTYTDPEVAHVGVGADDPRAQTVRVGLEHVDRAVVDGRTEGFCKLHVDSRGRILGATVVGAEAGELIAEVALAMTAGLRVRALVDAVHPYPSRAEILRKAAEAWLREHRWPRLQRLARGALALRRVWG
jgi:pyruvate/2-oxoglutarate dehydrogenase complex dihydrolipoamide dehydrogenase (E3) component